MKRRTRLLDRSSPKRNESLHKFLKPGALAQMRNLRISARTHRLDLISQIYLHQATASFPSPSTPLNYAESQMNTVDELPCFPAVIYGPACLRRKKLVPAKSGWFSSSTTSNPTTDSLPNPFVDMIASDSVAAP